MIVMGCDVGSLFTKIAVLDEDRLLADRIVRTTGRLGAEMAELRAAARTDAGLARGDVAYLAATGAGAALVEQAAFVVESVDCLGAAVNFYLPEAKLIIDLGGQSITALTIDGQGDVENLLRNDKCASGSGRFLEMMAAKLLLPIEQIDALVAAAARPARLSNQCAVFAESEVITHVNQGEPPADIIAGVCETVARMALAQARRFGSAESFTVTGGVARFAAVTRRLAEGLAGVYHPFPFDPRLAAAIGAALMEEV